MIIDVSLNQDFNTPENLTFAYVSNSSLANKKQKGTVIRDFGTVKAVNEKAYLITVKGKSGVSADFSTLGATIVAIRVPDKNGQMVDVVQGYNSVEKYTDYKVGHAGGTIGPCANRIDNGIFELNGKKFELEKNGNGGKTHCHSASAGLDIKNWKYESIKNGVKFTYFKKDGEGGYPANVTINVSYIITDKNELITKYEATTDEDTILNLTNHSYFNLDGEENTEEGSALNHLVQFPKSSRYTVTNENGIPTGELRSVKSTPYNFIQFSKIKDKINSNYQPLVQTNGFDQNYCIDGYDGKTLIDVAKVKSEKTGIEMTVSTNLPGFQFYTANALNPQPEGKCGKQYKKRSSLCIEPQFYPNAINTESFEKPVLKKGEKFDREIVYKFKVVK